jgi:hypothetical protein
MAFLNMPLFYLHLYNGEGVLEDDEGEECSDIAAACEIAVRSLREVSADEVRRGIIYTASYIEIEDDKHCHVATVRFADAVEISTKVEREPRLLH